MATFTFEITVDTEKDSGKNLSRDEQAEEIEQALIDADPGEIGDEGTYSITGWQVREIVKTK